MDQRSRDLDLGNVVDEFNFYEGYAKFSYNSRTLAIAYSPDYCGSGVEVYHSLFTGYQYTLPENVSLELHLGYNAFENNAEFVTCLGSGPVSTDSYTDWRIDINPTLLAAGVSLKYANTDIDDLANGQLCGGKAVFSLSNSF
jgi:uncharacterized protein (TIGR02001 family)